MLRLRQRAHRIALASLWTLPVLLASCGGQSASDLKNDVSVSECANDGSQRVRVQVKNSGSSTSDYLVAVARFNEETRSRRDTVNVLVRAVRSGETSSGFAFGQSFGPPGYTCEVVDVQQG